jgi:hypothetical protein
MVDAAHGVEQDASTAAQTHIRRISGRYQTGPRRSLDNPRWKLKSLMTLNFQGFEDVSLMAA